MAPQQDRESGGAAITYRLWQVAGGLELLLRGESAKLTKGFRRCGENCFFGVGADQPPSAYRVSPRRRHEAQWSVLGQREADRCQAVVVRPRLVAQPESSKRPLGVLRRCEHHARARRHQVLRAPRRLARARGAGPGNRGTEGLCGDTATSQAALLRSPERTLVEVFAQVDALQLGPYKPEECAPKVEESRRLLRVELGW